MNQSIFTALAELAPKNNPTSEAMPTGNIAIGSKVLVIWLKPHIHFLVKNICADQTVDLKQVDTSACINVNLEDVREVPH